MSEKTKELAKQVLETQEGITPEQLKALIEAEPAQASQPIPQAPVEPASAPAPQAPAATPAPVADPAQGQPNVLDFIPEKFRSKDVPTSLQNITKSYSELEAELKKQKDEMANLNKLVQSFAERGPEPIAQPKQPMPQVDADVDDAGFFERPTESARKVAAQVAAATLMAYHVQQERQKFVDGFKAQHPDFDNYLDDVRAILRARPDLDQNERNLPMVFEMAKKRQSDRLAAMRSQLGLEGGQPVQPMTPPPPAVDIDAITKNAYLKARDDILAEIDKRRRASGLQGASPAGTPDNRVQPRVTEKELSPDELLMQEMLNSGPKKLTLGE